MQSQSSSRRRLIWLLYPLWLLVCAVLFVAMRDWPDPSRRNDRISNEEAAIRTEAILRTLDSGKYSGFEVVNVSFARRGEIAVEPRWLVLCDEDRRSALDAAIVVELRASDGAFVRARRLPGHNAPDGAMGR